MCEGLQEQCQEIPCENKEGGTGQREKLSYNECATKVVLWSWDGPSRTVPNRGKGPLFSYISHCQGEGGVGILPPKEHWVMSGDSFGYHTRGLGVCMDTGGAGACTTGS